MTPKGVILHFGKQVRSENSFKLSHVAVTYLNHVVWCLEQNNTFVRCSAPRLVRDKIEKNCRDNNVKNTCEQYLRVSSMFRYFAV